MQRNLIVTGAALLSAALAFPARAQSTGGLPALRDDLDAEVTARIEADADGGQAANAYTDERIATEAAARQQGDVDALASVASAIAAIRAEVAAEAAERALVSADLARANLRIAALLADRRMTASISRASASFNAVNLALSALPPDATTLDPAIADELEGFQTDLQAIIDAVSGWTAACRVWRGPDPGVCPGAPLLAMLEEAIAALIDGRDDAISQAQSLRQQMTMDMRSKFIQTLSNIMRAIDSTSDTLTQNLK